MSKEEIKEQQETINIIAKQIAMMVKWWPIIASFGTLIIFIGASAIAGYKYDKNLVKQEEFIKAVNVIEKLNADVKTIKSNRIEDSIKLENVSQILSDFKSTLKIKYVTSKRVNGIVTFN